MDYEKQYLIEKICSKGRFNKYHNQITGMKCTIGGLVVGYRCTLFVEPFGDRCGPTLFSTSPVVSISNTSESLTIETKNTFYKLVEVEEGSGDLP